ncbi:carboxypeptidase-like regulatory domain-containing protein, partial [Spirosoma sp.]|uniref:carboxypeptidase-like regulatory domain-containing protein n=1 Tax=Spirosoma sp. TaxID=1899569 RepID=UPI0026111F7C
MKKHLPPQSLPGRLVSAVITQLLLTALCVNFTYAKNPLPLKSLADQRAITADRTLTGRVTDEKDEALPGVSVILKGTQRGTVTDADGRYKVEIPTGGATLVFSFVGYVSQEVRVGNQTSVNISLKADSKVLDEIVVIGYGTAKKSDLTGAVTSVKEAQLQERPTSSLNQALSGRMPGVQVNTNSGRPGGRTTVRIRGFSSINSSNNPLYVVDGV